MRYKPRLWDIVEAIQCEPDRKIRVPDKPSTKKQPSDLWELKNAFRL